MRPPRMDSPNLGQTRGNGRGSPEPTNSTADTWGAKKGGIMRTTSLSSGGHRVGRRGLWAAVTFVGLVLVVVDSAPATFDFGSWNGVGAGTYLNGDTVTVNLGPNTGFFGNTFSSNAVGALFDQPGASQYSHVANTVP